MRIYLINPLLIIKKSFKIIYNYWIFSSRLSEKKLKKRIPGFLDLLYSRIKYGASESNYICFKFYKLNGKERNRFITFWRNEKLWKGFSKDKHGLFLNKTSFNNHFKEFIHRDWIYTGNSSYEAIEEFIRKHSSMIVKPLDSAMGNGIYKIECPNEELISSFIDKYNLKQGGGGVIIEELLENVPEIKKLNPPSLNTLRMVTVIDKNGEYHLVGARIRMGANNSCTDNVCNGGLVCAIDEKTGIICSTAKDHVGNEFLQHPNSGIKLIGYKIPYWNDCIEITKRLAYTVPSARYVGWDLAITTKGIEVLEGNIPPDECVTQMNNEVGLWNDFLGWM